MNIQRVIFEEVNNPDRFSHTMPSKDELAQALDFAVDKIDTWMVTNESDDFPSEKTENLTYQPVKNIWGWTTGFFSGMVWLAYEYTGNNKYKELGLIHNKTFKQRLDNMAHLDHHDIGFLYSLSCVAGYKLTKDEFSKSVAFEAANLLASRYEPIAKHIDRGRVQGRPKNESKSIIDCSMNVPLLFWAYHESGNKEFYDMAYQDMIETAKYAVRDDASCFQGIIKDRYTGELIYQDGAQGYSDESAWARGQAWGIYGMALAYTYTKDIRFLELGKRLVNYYLNHLPEDDICGWDLIFTEKEAQRDTSAATPAICGMLEIARHLPVTDKHKKIYEQAALSMLKTLNDKYTTRGLESNGILNHGVYVLDTTGGKGLNVDDLCIWGDYYYMEALVRVLKVWEKYW